MPETYDISEAVEQERQRLQSSPYVHSLAEPNDFISVGCYNDIYARYETERIYNGHWRDIIDKLDARVLQLVDERDKFEARASRLQRALVAAGVTEKLVDLIAEGE